MLHSLVDSAIKIKTIFASDKSDIYVKNIT